MKSVAEILDVHEAIKDELRSRNLMVVAPTMDPDTLAIGNAHPLADTFIAQLKINRANRGARPQ